MEKILKDYERIRSKLYGDNASLRSHYHFAEEFMKKYNVPYCRKHDNSKPFVEPTESFEKRAWNEAVNESPSHVIILVAIDRYKCCKCRRTFSRKSLGHAWDPEVVAELEKENCTLAHGDNKKTQN